MNDKELFLKYNIFNTLQFIKDDTLTEKLYNNELNQIQTNWVQDKWLILLHASYNCNLNCVYCENHALRETYNNTIMSKQTLKNIVSKLGANIREITWHGGEPLLLPNDYFILLDQERKKYNFNFEITLQTNATLLTPEKEKLLNDLNIKWGTSFDGIYNTQNRGLLSTKSLLNYYKSHLNDNNKSGFITVITKDSINDLINNYEYIKQLGITMFQTCIVRENVIDATNPYLVENKLAVHKMLEYIDYWIHDTTNPILDSYIERNIKRILGSSQSCEDNNCIGGWLIIDPLGNISTCGMSAKESPFCNINEINDYTDLLTNIKYIQTFNAQANLIKNQCLKNNCLWLNSCYGGCMGLNYEQDNNYKILNQRNCEYIQNLLTGIYELIKDIDITQEKLYNPYFLKILKECNYYSLTEIKAIEKKRKNN